MKTGLKTIALVIISLGVLTLGGYYAQRTLSSRKAIKLNKQDMELLLGTLPPAQLKEMQSSPDQKKQLVQSLKEVLAVGRAAELAGYADRPNVKTEIAFQVDLVLNNAYSKKNPGAKATPEETAAYNQKNPNEFDSFMQSRPAQVQQRAQGAQREQFKEQFAEFKVLAGKARKDKLDRDRGTEVEIMVNRYNILASEYEKDLENSDKLVTDDSIQQYYAEHQNDYEEVRARHILISTSAPPQQQQDPSDSAKKPPEPKALSKEEARAKAQSILDRIHKGEDFAKLAQENSDDTGSKTQGGDVGYFTRGKMVPAFEQAAFSLKPGEVSGIVESPFGYHIIKVEDHRMPLVSDAKVNQEITGKLKQDKIKEKLDAIVNKSRVQVAEDFDIPSPAAPVLPGAQGGLAPPPAGGAPPRPGK
jgi:peptidyl-prolyl cis-trans isomerase C